MIGAASEDALSMLWKSRSSIYNHILNEYNAFLPAVRLKLQGAITKLHISFNSWMTCNNWYALTGVFVHYLDKSGQVVDHMLALPEQLGKHSGVNYAVVIDDILKQFTITPERLGFFMTDNAPNNDTAIQELSTAYHFDEKTRQIRCLGHILNHVAHSILFGKDQEAFKNTQENLLVSKYSALSPKQPH